MNLPEYPYPGDENARSDVESGVYGKHHTFREGEVVLDIGAHVGFFTEWVRPKIGESGRVIAFEPHPRNFYELKQRCGDMPNVKLVNAACCFSSLGNTSLYNNSHNSGGHSLFEGTEDHFHFDVSVSTINAGHYCCVHHIKPTFVKIDAERSEYDILKSLVRETDQMAFAVECHDEFLLDNCSTLLEAHNYSCIVETNMLFAEPK